MQRLLVVSLDALGDVDFDRMMDYPVFSAFMGDAHVVRGASSVFVSNTYPIHASVSTGVPPCEHGLVCNTDPFPARHAPWHSAAADIHARTLWDAAAEKGLRTAAVMWPSTAHSKAIRYNVPEVLPAPGKSQVRTSLAAGSKWLQLRLALRHRRLLRGITQPWRDAFVTACMADILRSKRPGLALMHLTAYDSLCHQHGKNYGELRIALASLDENLNTLLGAAGKDTAVIVFSDHAQLPVHQSVLPNDALVRMGLLRKTGEEYARGDTGCFFECAGGSAFFHPGALDEAGIRAVRAAAGALPGFARFLREEEMQESGHGELPFGFCAHPGFSLDAVPGHEKANHGYPLDYADYKVFYAVRAPGYAPGTTTGGSLLHLAGIAADILGLDMPAACRIQ